MQYMPDSKGENGMCKGLGLDICEISRMEKMLMNEPFLNRYCTEDEISYIKAKGKGAAQTLAGIFAAKEAFSKALGTGITFSLKDVCVIHDSAGRPGYALRGTAAELGKGDTFLLSVTHDGGVAAAVCIRDGCDAPACQKE